MKKFLFLAMALFCAFSLMTSCDKSDGAGENEDPVNFIGEWIYTGIDIPGDDDLNIVDNYLFKVDEKEIQIYRMDKTTLNTTLSYTRKGNKITFTPAFNGKYNSAVLHQTYGTGKESICWDCGNGQVYNFSAR